MRGLLAIGYSVQSVQLRDSLICHAFDDLSFGHSALTKWRTTGRGVSLAVFCHAFVLDSSIDGGTPNPILFVSADEGD